MAFTKNSIKKFSPINRITVYSNIDFPASVAAAATISEKNSKKPARKIPVFNNGTLIEARTHPIKGCLFLNGLKIKPAIKPAAPVLIKTNKTVAQAFIVRNAPVSGAVKFKAPSTKPRNKPPNGPNKQAPTAIGIKVKLSVRVPILTTVDKKYRQTSIAVRTPRPAIVLIVKNFFIAQELYFNKIIIQ